MMKSKDLLKSPIYTSYPPSPKPLFDTHLLGLWSASGNEWTPMIQEECFQTLKHPVQPHKKIQLPSNASLFWAWLFLLMTVGAMLMPVSTSLGHEQSTFDRETNRLFLAIPK